MIWIRKGELMKKNITKTLFWLLVLALAFIFLVPMLYAVYNSLLPLDKVNHIVSPTEFTLNNYVDLFTDYPIARWFINTVIVAVITLICQLVTALLAGYALAKLRFPGRNLSFLIVLVTLMIPFQVLLTPLYIIISGLGWNDTLTGLIVPFMLNTLYVFMARQYYVTIPGELMEAARIDGLGYIGSYFRIVLPLSKPIIATITIFNFVQSLLAYLFQNLDSIHPGHCNIQKHNIRRQFQYHLSRSYAILRLAGYDIFLLAHNGFYSHPNEIFIIYNKYLRHRSPPQPGLLPGRLYIPPAHF